MVDCLVVDTDAVSRRLAALLLKRLGHPAMAVDAVETAPAGRHGLILVGVDGSLDCILALQARIDPADRPQTRLVAMIPSGSNDVRQACLDAGADAVLVKPLALQALADLLTPSGPADDFNAQAWADLLRLFGADGVLQLVNALVDDLPTQQQRMAAAIREQDLPALKRVAHALRGVSLQLGAEGLARLCTETEEAAAASRTEAAATLGSRLIRRHEALVERLRNETARH